MTANIIVKPLDCSHTVAMEHVCSIPKLPITQSCSAKKEDIKNVEHLEDIPIATTDQPVSLLIGADTPETFFTLDEKRGNQDQPIAIKTPLGWTVQGPCSKRKHIQLVSINHISNANLDNKLNAMWKHDFQDSITIKQQ